MPLISVLMTVYNEERYVREAIQSILNQTFQDFELIIIDDASEDRTVNIINSIQDNRISLYSLSKNMGVGYANNYAVQHARGKYIAKMDADDLAHPERLAIQFEYLEKNPYVDVVDSFISYFTDLEKVEKSERYYFIKNIYEGQLNKEYNSETLSKELYWFCNVVHSAVMYRKELTDHFHYPLGMKVCEDYSYFYQMNKQGIKFKKLPLVLLSVRLSEHSITATRAEELLMNIFEIKKLDIADFINNDARPFAIWGAGNLASMIHKYLVKKLNKKNSIFIDTNAKEDRELFGINVVTPESIEMNMNNIKVLIASSYGKFEIVEQLEKEGFKNLNDYFVIY